MSPIGESIKIATHIGGAQDGPLRLHPKGSRQLARPSRVQSAFIAWTLEPISIRDREVF